ncbi:MAG: hypothetical protein IPI44_20815 [Sulfuritalea sp.]|nr:hypothetical protein [Sulfuritalea sp.]
MTRKPLPCPPRRTPESISKGKAGVPVELGLRVCIMEDQHRFILHHQVMEKQTDDPVAVAMVRRNQATALPTWAVLAALTVDSPLRKPAGTSEPI